MFCSFDSRLVWRSTGLPKIIQVIFILLSAGVAQLSVDMLDSKRGGRLLQLAVALVALLSLCAELGDAAEVEDVRDTELVTKPTDSRANRAKRRGGSDVLRG